ncbi:hypothetical protein FGG08_006988 [Glutinoglossum americanum]|uniref:Uncharacterized protein n=1 Tax=Glutinoglossum americanum TaxID=1670608 RepID=A0A9P8L1D4_9PEZI|nr:hypothetical protein FGG08_006988 [Glutinoglossum americanum]
MELGRCTYRRALALHDTHPPQAVVTQPLWPNTLFAVAFLSRIVPIGSNLYISANVLQWIKEGKSIQDVQLFRGSSLECLRHLPGTKQIDAFYGEGVREIDVGLIGTILNSKQEAIMNDEATSQVHAVTGIAFGVLVPQASKNLAEAVKFTVAGTPGKYIDKLKGLVNALHNRHFEVTGLADKINANPRGDEKLKVELDSIFAEKGVFGEHVTMRYLDMEKTLPREMPLQHLRAMRLLEHLAALVDVDAGGAGGRLDRVYSASCGLMQKVYVAAVDRSQHRLDEPQWNKLREDLKMLRGI